MTEIDGNYYRITTAENRYVRIILPNCPDNTDEQFIDFSPKQAIQLVLWLVRLTCVVIIKIIKEKLCF